MASILPRRNRPAALIQGACGRSIAPSIEVDMGVKAPSPQPVRDPDLAPTPSTAAPLPKKPNAADVCRQLWNATVGQQHGLVKNADGSLSSTYKPDQAPIAAYCPHCGHPVNR